MIFFFLLHSLFNEYSGRQINTDRTVARRGGRQKRRKYGEEGQRTENCGRSGGGILLISVKPCKSQEVGTKVYKAKPVYPRAVLARLYGRKRKPCNDVRVDVV